jgi:predicted AlkP superfamily phosphohydrolase/phosphomutase
MMMSDHGHGSLDGKVQPNLLLKDWGFLSIRSQTGQVRRRLQKAMARMMGKVPKRFEAQLGIEHELDLDWSRTRACVMHAGIYGFLYLNVKGRQDGGIVEPDDYESVRDELIERFSSVTCRDPRGKTIQVFSEIHKSEELYRCSREEQAWMPDLLLVPQPGLAVVRKIRGNQTVRWSSARRMEGTHRVEGIVVAHGPFIKAGGRIHAHIADIAPTLLAALGLRVPADMEGRVLQEMFSRELRIEHEPPQAIERARMEEVYSEAEKEALTKRLADLGYLE